MKTKLLTDKALAKAARASEPQELVAEVRELILAARGVNAALVALHWQIGQRIRKEILAAMPFGNSRDESQRDSAPKPRVASRELPWEKPVVSANPNGVVARWRRWDTTPLGLKIARTLTQGSLADSATLGWRTQSLWDCRTIGLSVVPHGTGLARNIRKALRLGERRAGYGEEIVATLSRQLTAEFGGGFAEKNLRRRVQFAEVFPDDKIVATLSKELGWSHFVESLPLKKHLQRDFCAERIGIRQPVAAELTLADILSPVARVIASLPIPRDTCSSAPAIICQPVASKLTVTTGVMLVETRLPRNCQTLSGELEPRSAVLILAGLGGSVSTL